MENAALVNMNNDHETTKLLTYSSQSPTTLEVSSRLSQQRSSLMVSFARKPGVWSLNCVIKWFNSWKWKINWKMTFNSYNTITRPIFVNVNRSNIYWIEIWTLRKTRLVSECSFYSVVLSIVDFSCAPKSANWIRTCVEFEKWSRETVGRTCQWTEDNENSGQFLYQSTERETRTNECSEGKTREEIAVLKDWPIFRLKSRTKMLDYVFRFKSWRSIWKTMN